MMNASRNRQGPDPTAAFFEEVVAEGPQPLLRHRSGTIRLDLGEGVRVEHWYVTVDRGSIHVSHRAARADASMRTEKTLFDGMVRGTLNADAAILRGVVDVEGDLGLLASFARLFPGPPRSRVTFLEREQKKGG